MEYFLSEGVTVTDSSLLTQSMPPTMTGDDHDSVEHYYFKLENSEQYAVMVVHVHAPWLVLCSQDPGARRLSWNIHMVYA